jgi:putative transposase
MNWFMDLDDAREKIEEFRVDYNTLRPHSSIYDLPPEEFYIYIKLTPNSLVKSVTNKGRISFF